MTETYPKTTIKITTKTEYEREMKRITKLFSQKETEETWDQFKRALDNLSQWITQENISSWTTFPTHLKQLKLPIIRCLESPRTLLSASASGLLKSTAQTMKTDFSKLNPLFVEAIIKQFGSTNKIHSARIQSDYKEVIEHAKLPKCISLFSEYLINKIKHKNNSHLRFCLADCLVVLIRVNPETVLKRLSQDIERAIRVASTDACASVRSAIRQVYKAYDEKMPELASLFYAHLTRAEQKHLEPQVHPVTLRRSSSFSSSSTLHTTPILPQKSSSTLSSHKRHQKTPSTLSSQSIHTPNIKTTVNNHPQSKHTLHLPCLCLCQ
ncbi:clasp N terminal-domain-containing protein [Blakeslea trispora]|nr:clasp N terminal-domain-containing protein [Blakeslea trispora]